ncbi:MAG: hypothetical protein NTY98_17755 [Verrucomicrobia bacterium]|nr:hypothetical protein [Verrucomicrobiota bacterium]
MKIELSRSDIETLLKSLKYSKRYMSEALVAPDDGTNAVRRANIEKVELVETKLSAAREEHAS